MATPSDSEREEPLRAVANLVNDLRARAEEAEETVKGIWQALGIATYEQAKPISIAEHVARLREALEPFAKAAEHYAHSHDGYNMAERPGWAGKDHIAAVITVGDLRRAAAIAKGEKPAARIYHQSHAYVPESALAKEREGGEKVAEAVAVKPLEWDRYDRADIYAIKPTYGGGPKDFYLSRAGIVLRNAFFDTVDEAKAFAQADHEVRILAAIGQKETPAQRE